MRIMENNLAELATAAITYSSQLTGFPFSNAINKFRSKVAKFSGQFELTDDNRGIYFTDGTDKAIQFDAGSYKTPESLCTEIQTKLNASTSDWAVTYDRAGETYKFKIENVRDVKLKFSISAGTIWDTLGFTGSSDITAKIHIADEQRNHTSEYAVFDLGYNAPITFLGCIGPLDETFSVSDSAIVKLMGNNLNDFDTPALSVTLDITTDGIFSFIDLIYSDTGYRYWKFEIIDKYNPAGPECLSIGHIYLGDHVDFETKVDAGFGSSQVDPSSITESESGALYFDSKQKYSVFDGTSLSNLARSEKDKFKKLFNKVGKITPFYVSLDHDNDVSTTINEFTKYVVFQREPKLRHIIRDIFSVSLGFREVL